MLKKYFDIALIWIPIAIAITLLCFLVYATVQQNFRQSANDPQIAIAEDSAIALKNGAPAQALIPPQEVDLSQSLTPFLIIYNSNAKPITSSGKLDGETPVPPQGVFEFAKIFGENRFTWEPKPNVRIAAVMVYYQNGDNPGFVLAGRSLREVEKRESQLSFMTFAVWLFALFSTLVATIFLFILKERLARGHG